MFSVLTDNWPLFRDGFWLTIRLFVVSGVLSLVFGTILGAFRVSPVPALRGIGTGYVNVLRNTPLTLVFAFLFFGAAKMQLAVPQVMDLQVEQLLLQLLQAPLIGFVVDGIIDHPDLVERRPLFHWFLQPDRATGD